MDEKEKKKLKQKEQEDMQELLKAIEELEREKAKLEKQNPKKKRPLLAIEFGGVFHRNRLVNFIFSFIINLTLGYLIIEVFNLAEYNDILIVIGLMLLYTFLEEAFRLYMMMKQFKLVLRSIGTVFYFGYVIIFYLLDQYVFSETFDFLNGTLLVVFVLVFTLLRYFFGQGIKNYFRKHNMR